MWVGVPELPFPLDLPIWPSLIRGIIYIGQYVCMAPIHVYVYMYRAPCVGPFYLGL